MHRWETIALLPRTWTGKFMFGFGLWMAPHGPLGNDTGETETCWERDFLRSTPSLRNLLGTLIRTTADDLPVLLTGETGTGKTHLAQLIHEYSWRKAQPLVLVSCSALSPREQGKELFGDIQSPGIVSKSSGLFGKAGDGTLLLKEVDALGLEQQTQLARFLPTAKDEPVGSSQTRPHWPRVMASTRLNLMDAVAQGKFSSDLYDRLRGLSLHLPPLRERRGDIGPLVRELMAQFVQELGKGILSLDAAALATLEAFPWPGNLRQLRNVVHQAVLASPGPELLKWDLPLGVREWGAPPKQGVPGSRGSGSLFRNLSFR
jgi:DNA-binding NtrC family response regulator